MAGVCGRYVMAFEYAKAVLYAYPHLAALAEAVGQSAENQAMLSFRSMESTLALAEKIADTLAVVICQIKCNRMRDCQRTNLVVFGNVKPSWVWRLKAPDSFLM